MEVVKVQGFSVQRSDNDGVRYLRLTGELDLATADTLRHALDGFTDGERVVVDTTELEFIDSTGLHTLVEVRNRLGKGFIVVPGRATERLFDLAGLAEFFQVE